MEKAERTAKLKLAHLHMSKSQFDEAIDYVEGVLDFFPEDREALEILGFCEAMLGNYDSALETLKSIIARYGPSSKVYVYFSLIYTRLGDSVRASRYFRSAGDLSSDMAETWHYMGRAYFEDGDFALAQECFEKALKIDPNMHRTWISLGVIFRRSGDRDGAERCYKKALEIEPKSAEALYDLGNLYRSERQPKQAERFFKKALQIDAMRYDAWNNLGVVLTERGEVNEARLAYVKALKIKPHYAYALYNLACLWAGLKNPRRAVSALRLAIEVDPDRRIKAQNDPDFFDLLEDRLFRDLIFDREIGWSED